MLGRRRLVDLAVKETSGVDHPATGAEGWAVIKAAAAATGADPLLERLKAEGLDVEKMAPAALASMLSDSVSTLPPNAQGPARALITALTKEAPMPPDPTNPPAPTLESLAAQVTALTADLAKAKTEAEEATKAKATADAALAAATKALDPNAGKSPTPEEALAKALDTLPEPLRKAFEDQAAALVTVTKQATEERDARLSSEYLAKAKTMPALPAKAEDLATVLRKAADILAPTEFAELDRMLKAADAQLREAGLWKEVGGAGGDAGGDAMAAINKAAQDLRTAAAAAGNDLSLDQAIAKVGELNPELVARHRADMNAAAARNGR